LGHPVTPDGRYFVVRGRLWPMSNPSLPHPNASGWSAPHVAGLGRVMRATVPVDVFDALTAVKEVSDWCEILQPQPGEYFTGLLKRSGKAQTLGESILDMAG
jgi:hypothetical protein